MQKSISTEKAWYIVFISALLGCSISSAFPQFSMTVSTLAENTGMSTAFLLTGDTVKSAAIVAAMITAGYTYKRFGVRWNMIVSIICTVVPQFVIPHTTLPALLIIMKIVQGFSSLCFPVLLLVIMDVIPEGQRGLATTVFNGIFYSGGGVGSILTGFFITRFNWIVSYYALGGIMLFLGCLWVMTVSYTAPEQNTHPATSEGSGELSSQEENDRSLTRELLSNSTTWLLIIAFLSTTFVVQAITVDLPLFSEYLGYNAMEISKLNVPVALGLIAACLVSGKLSDLFTARSSHKATARILALALGPILIVFSSILLITMDLTSFPAFWCVSFLFSFSGSWGFGTFYSILPEIYSPRRLPIITGLAGGAGDMGMPAAPLLVGVVFGARGLWQYSWTVCAVMALLSIAAAVILIVRYRRPRRDND